MSLSKPDILDAVHKLILKQPFDRWSLGELASSSGVVVSRFKGLFPDKRELMIALVDRFSDKAFEATLADVHKREFAIDKLAAIFEGTQAYKVEHAAVVKAVMPVLFHDSNMRFRKALTDAKIKKVIPILADIIHLGNEEGVFSCEKPELAAEMVLYMGASINERMGAQLAQRGLSDQEKDEIVDALVERIQFWQDMVEQAIGAPKGIIEMIDKETIRAFL